MSVLFTRRGEAPSLGKKASKYNIGDSVFIPVDGVNKECLVVHQGLPSSDYDSSCDNTWLLMKDIYLKKKFDSSDNDYENSSIRNGYLDGTFLGLLDPTVLNAIKQIKLPYWEGTGNDGIYRKGIYGLSTKIFLLSSYEVGVTNSGISYVAKVGAKLSYFESGISANDKRVAKLNGTAIMWWLRDPYLDSDHYVNYIGNTGAFGNGDACDVLNGMRPAFVIDSNTRFDPDTNVIL